MATMNAQEQKIVIIGSGCRFPGGANTPSKLWELLREPHHLAESIPQDRFSISGFYHPDGQYHGHSNVKKAYFLEGKGVHRRFDASFFGINRVEANVMDPQARLLMETVYEALEAAGQSVDDLRGSNTAVFAGQMVADYEQVMVRDNDTMGTYHATGTSRALLANRISYFYDWHGPSETIDTACSSSLVAVHHAVQQLRSGQSRVAIAAGANLIFDPQCFAAESTLNMLSPEGQSRMWDVGANGYGRGEGIAAVVLKTLSAAEEDGDHIECVIAETAVNHDGKTRGITMPSARAQTQLIQDCYARAGLDLTNPSHRPQYFEAHGTGTPAGDPVEAEAIASAFFPQRKVPDEECRKLLVGSIKTVVGHTEGTAGLAGILKTSLAMQNSLIPPNLLFQELNPSIRPFYANLHVVTTPEPWPDVAEGMPRRSSVNSFGFGGTNAHAILESYARKESSRGQPSACLTPFVFSAASEASLRSYMSTFSKFLRENEEIVNIRDLAYTLYSRRTRLSVATAVAALTVDDLRGKVDMLLQKDQSDPNLSIKAQATNKAEASKVLGIFTGQGAQWAKMGSELIQESTVARKIINDLEVRLSQLPIPPSWSLMEEMERDGPSSRINEAVISQTVCTAVQILQVKLLFAADVHFSAVVGHSSGEIAAAYAAGSISSRDAICIAYYRGLYSQFACGSDGQPGSMMAIGTTAEDAQELCDTPEYTGRVHVAAINAPESVTLSGDRDAIEDLKVVFEDEGKFTRILRVDVAYHSHHLKEASKHYLDPLLELDIQVRSNLRSPWFSSVHGRLMCIDSDPLKGSYWVTNMVSPVRYMQAVQSALSAEGPFEMAIELGPHPALKGPSLQIFRQTEFGSIPYANLFCRGTSALASFAEGLGQVWVHAGPSAVNLHGYEEFLSGGSARNQVRGLPTYAWNHEKEYWHESRYARAIRMREGPVHEILGHITPDSTHQDKRWRHILCPTEVPWLKGHRLQGQIVFPAAAYVALALEAALALCHGSSPTLIEVEDVEIGKALSFDLDETRVETILSVTDIRRQNTSEILARFSYSAGSKMSANQFDLLASGRVRVTLGSSTVSALSAGPPRSPSLIDVNEEEFYESMRDLEYEYSGPFASLHGLRRKLGSVTGFVRNLEPSELLIHPGMLDAAFQSAFLVHCAPGDGGLDRMHIPRRIRKISVNPDLCAREVAKCTPVPFSSLRSPGADFRAMISDINLYSTEVDNSIVQVQGLECVPLSSATAQDDKEIFSTLLWDVASPNAEIVSPRLAITAQQRDMASLLERMAVFYLRILERDLPAEHPARLGGPYASWFRFASHCTTLAHQGQLPLWISDWENDTKDRLHSAILPHSDVIDVMILRAVGESIVEIATGEASAIDICMRNDMLSQFYMNGFGLAPYTKSLARIIKQIAHRYPHMDILEVGAGTGACTEAVLSEIGSAFSSYTFTDISTSFFDSARPLGNNHPNQMMFKALDISKAPSKQGFQDHAYDVVVASLVLHATPNLEETLRNTRRLLKPGGYLVALELLPANVSYLGVIFGAFPGWWLGADEGRVLTPAVGLGEWDRLLRKAGFSGCDTNTNLLDEHITPGTIFVSQALDDRVTFIRDPFSAAPTKLIQDLVILGGDSPSSTVLATGLEYVLAAYCGNVRRIASVIDVPRAEISSTSTILSLVSLDGLQLTQLNDQTWEALKQALLETGSLVWLTQGRRASDPHANTMIGLVRSVVRETSLLNYLFLDMESTQDLLDASIISKMVLQNAAASQWRGQGDLHITAEPELVLSNGQLLIPRLAVSKEMNARYNSSRRAILDETQELVQNMGISVSNSEYLVEEEVLPRGNKSSCMRMHVSHSVLSALRCSEFGLMFLVLGPHYDSGDHIVAFSAENNRVICPWENISAPVEIRPGSETKLLSLMVHHILISDIIRGLFEGDRILVYNPDPMFAAVLLRIATPLGIDVTCIKHPNAAVSIDPTWLTVHANATDSEIFCTIPDRVSVYVDLSAHDDSAIIGNRIRSRLPQLCRSETLDTLFSSTAMTPSVSRALNLRNRLHAALTWSLEYLNSTHETQFHAPEVSIQQIAASESRVAPATVVDWRLCTQTPVRLKSASTLVSLDPNRTYWLAGLSGGLGQSLCEWMIHHGARNIVMSSRNPRVDGSWLDDMRTLGAALKISSCDLTNSKDVVALHAELASTMPSIAGVVQGAMVLRDLPLRNMTLDALLDVMQPKVQGSICLNDLFQQPTLDFFVFLSSATSIIGNPGQANYTAANLFMSSLAAQRRNLGLAASVMHIGPIYGVGYISQLVSDGKTPFPKNNIRSGAYIATSEHDFHELFAEAVLAGSPQSVSPAEMVSGIRRVGANEPIQPIWRSDPLMSHFIRHLHTDEQVEPTAKSNRVPIKTRLAEASDYGQVESIIRDAFLSKISTLFQHEGDDSQDANLEDLRLDELGIDSLSAVEIRSWSMKSFEVNIPVLKILDGVTIRDLVSHSLEKIPRRLIPQVGNLPLPAESESQESSSQSSGETVAKDDPDTSCSSEVEVNSEQSPISKQSGIAKPIIQKSFPLSFSQDMFWFLWACLADKTSLNHTGWARLIGTLDIAKLENAVRLVSQQHESLRTCFFVQDGKPVQGIMESSTLRLEVQQIQSEDEVARMAELLQNQIFDVERGSVMRLVLLSLTPEKHSLIFGVHPLAFDGTSFQVFLTELFSYYMNPEQRKNTRQYSEFSEKQHADFESGKYDAECDFWRAEYATLPPPLPILSLSAATSRPPLTSFENEQAVLWISQETKTQVQATCRRFRVTPFHFYLAVFRTLLLRYAADSEEICIGFAETNRTEDQMMEIIGTFVNLLPLRFITKGSATFESLLQDARNKSYAALANSSLPFPALLALLDVPRSSTHTPLFQCFIDYRVGQRTQDTWGDVDLQFMDFKNLRMAYDVALDIVDEPDGHCVHIFEVQKDLYGSSGAERLAKSYEHLLKAFSADPVLTLDEPTIFQASEINETLTFSQGPSIPAKWPQTVNQRIDEVIESKPQDPAIQLAQGETFTYGNLSGYAKAIAASLQASSIGHGTPVAVLQEPTHLWIASILGIFRLGSVYLPLDLSLPWARLKAMVNDCRPGAVLVDQNTRHNVGKLGAIPGLVVIDVSSVLGHDFACPIQSAATKDSMAAVLYTSGSSGRPKGILLTHGGLCNWAEHVPPMYNLESEVVLQQTSSTFDVSLIQILTALTHGGLLCLVPRKLRGDASAIGSIMARYNVTFTCATPTEYSSWIEHGRQELVQCEHWRTAICIGESIPATLPKKIFALRKEGLHLINLYGPTEASLAASGMVISRPPDPTDQSESQNHEPIAAGCPLPNYSIHVLDAQLRPLPVGVQGEIYIGGPGVGLGYLGKPELTAQKFVPDVIKHPSDLPIGSTTFHRSGDMGRWRVDGTLMIEGRIEGDTQMKLRGLRIDISEVEHAIMVAAQGMLFQAVVTARKLSVDSCPVLVAHVVFSQGCHQDDCDDHIHQIQSGLYGLPQYMRPAVIIPVRNLPNTNAGKLDRKAVADLVLPSQENVLALEDSKALTETEVFLKSVWQDVIGQSVSNSTNITPRTDFFQVGGTSLLLLSLRARITETFEVRIPLIRMFDHSTLSSMACWIDDRLEQRQQLDDFGGVDGIIDWDEETQLPSSLMALSLPETTSNVGPVKIVVLTGATGHLGRGLLNALIQDPKIEKVHCIGIRNTNARRDIVEDEKVRIHGGDLNLPFLGLSEDNAERIFDEADLIIHNGADMSYLKTYASLRKCNVDSTKELARLSAHRSIPFHFISTVSVGHIVAEARASTDVQMYEGEVEKQQDPQDFVFRPVSAAAYHPAKKLAPGAGSSATAHGYIASKWVSECFLERLNTRFPAWQVSIHRPSLIARRGDRVAGSAPGLELVQNMRHYSSLLRAVPIIAGGRVGGVFDLVQLETVVDGILAAAVDQPEHVGEAEGVRFYHHTGGVELPLGDLRRWLVEDEEGDGSQGIIVSEVEEIDLAEWTRRAASLGMHETIVAMLEEFESVEGAVHVPRVGK